MTDTEQQLRFRQLCPGWCGGEDHQAAVEECGGDLEPAHYRMVGDSAGWCVWIEQGLTGENGRSLGPLMINAHGRSEDQSEVYNLAVSPPRARSIAAWLVRAADIAETTPFL
jgi:hypothetical protein